MSVRPDPVIPETRRRRASTTEKSERILKMSRSLTLTRSVLAGTLAEATPNQLDFIERWFTAELDSRERSKRLRLLKQAGFPADKTLDGYDWTNLKMPADWGRAQLENLDFVAGCEDLVLYGCLCSIVFLQIGVHSMGTIFQQHRRLVSSRNCVVGSAAFFLVIWS